MADGSLQRFQRVMDKLYHAPKQKPSLLHGGGGEDLLQKSKKSDWGSRRGDENYSKAAASSSSVSKEAQACRPWDRKDLMRRLATFKAMTWFGKPKVVSALNCARRGWVNVGMDTIACEACGSRLLFSTPSSWTFQQVEKAAAVFSLKLDNGHKLLCPWMDNTCDESLAMFPPIPLPELVKGYEERSNALLQLSALPIISSSAISHMSCAELERFLEKSSSLECTLENGVKIIERQAAGCEDLVSDTAASSLYSQAKKIIALCGWEVRLLPYSVESDNMNKSDEKTLPEMPRETSSNKSDAISIYPRSSSLEVGGKKSIHPLVQYHPDLASAVLDCKLCGACVGLWTFKSIPRPMEAFVLTDIPDPCGQSSCIAPNIGGNSEIVGDTVGGPNMNNGNMNKERNLTLSLTIAGGAPPTKQNYRPKISFPLVSRHLRADLSSDKYAEHQDRSGELVVPADKLKRKRDEDDFHSSVRGKCVPSDQDENVTRKKNSSGSGHVVLFSENPTVEDENNHTSEAPDNRSTETVSASSPRNYESSNALTAAPDATVNQLVPADPGLVFHSSREQVSGFYEAMVSSDIKGSKLVPLRLNDVEELDPVTQHRPFCPWISPSDGKYLPGWKLTLQALDKKGGSPNAKDAPTGLLDEGNDPLVSVRKLFSTPQSKQKKQRLAT